MEVVINDGYVKLEFGDISDFLSIALSGDSNFCTDGPDDFNSAYSDLEDTWADALVHGYSLDVEDTNDGIHYELTLAKIQEGFNKILCHTTGSRYENALVRNLNMLLHEDGDFYDANNIFQYIVLGDIVYG